MSDSHGRHPSMQGYGHDEVSNHRQPSHTRVHVLSKETADRLEWSEEREGQKK